MACLVSYVTVENAFVDISLFATWPERSIIILSVLCVSGCQ